MLFRSKSILELHNPENIKKEGNFIKRLIFDEIMATFLTNSKIRSKIRKYKKSKKKFTNKPFKKIINNINFTLTNDQLKAIDEINNDLKSNSKMFRLLQGDVGSGKTIVSVIAALNAIKAGYQVAIMAPTEILAIQHYNFILENFNNFCNPEILTGKTEYKKRKNIL